MKKSWVMIAAIVGVLAIGATGGVILAQEDPADGGSPFKSLVSRVAAILGINEGEVQAAFDQAREEIRDEALDRKLASLVEQGRLTEEQADEYREWYQARPQEIAPGRFFGRHGRYGFFGRGIRGGHGGFGFGKGSLPAPSPVPDTTSL